VIDVKTCLLYCNDGHPPWGDKRREDYKMRMIFLMDYINLRKKAYQYPVLAENEEKQVTDV
jgi:hypothetical protein